MEKNFTPHNSLILCLLFIFRTVSFMRQNYQITTTYKSEHPKTQPRLCLWTYCSLLNISQIYFCVHTCVFMSGCVCERQEVFDSSICIPRSLLTSETTRRDHSPAACQVPLPIPNQASSSELCPIPCACHFPDHSSACIPRGLLAPGTNRQDPMTLCLPCAPEARSAAVSQPISSACIPGGLMAPRSTR